jgi:tetratricopeptide (TPR) repeat protein
MERQILTLHDFSTKKSCFLDDRVIAYLSKTIDHLETGKSFDELVEVLDDLANVYQAKDDMPNATNTLLREADILGTLGNMNGKASIVMKVGSSWYQEGDNAAAIDLYRQAVDIYTSVGNLPKVAEAFQNLGTAYRNAGQFDDAHACFQKSMGINEELGRFAEIAWTFASVARAHDMAGEGDEAIDAKQESIDTYLGLDAMREAAEGLADIAALQAKYGRHDAMNTSLEQAAMLYEELRMPDQASQCRSKKMSDN